MSPLIMGMVHRRISIAATQALIEYTWSADSYALNGSDEVIIDNKGSSGATNDLLLNTGEPIEVSAGQEFDVLVEADSACVMYHSITAKIMTYVTSISSPSYTMPQDTIGVIATLKTEPDAADKTRLDAEPWQILNLWDEKTTNLTSIVKADIQHLYNPNILQGGFLLDLTAPSTELITNGIFDTDTTGWAEARDSSTLSVVNNRLNVQADGTSSFGASYEITGLDADKWYKLILDFWQGDTTYVYLRASIGSNLTNEYVDYGLIEDKTGYSIIFQGGASTMYVGFLCTEDNKYFQADNISLVKLPGLEIPNYLDSMYENVDFNKAGVQTTMLDIDATGRTTAMVYDESKFYSKGFGNTQFNPSSDASEWWLEEIIDGVVYQHKFDGTNLTTYTDNSSGGAGAHSPENADYLQGKGVYPKVTADPYTTYTLSHFMWWTGDGYTSYNQSDRYTEIS